MTLHTGQEPLLADKRILVLEGSTKQVNMPSKEDAYNIRVVNLNIGSVEILGSKEGICNNLLYCVIQSLVCGMTSLLYELEPLIICM